MQRGTTLQLVYRKSIRVFTLIFLAVVIAESSAKPPVSKSKNTRTAQTPQEVRVEGFVREKELYSDKDIHYVVRLRWKGEPGAIEIIRPHTPELDGLERIFTEQSNSVDPETKESMIDYLFVLHPLREGKVKIGKVGVKYIDKTQDKQYIAYVPAKELTILPPPEKAFPITKVIQGIFALIIIVLVGGFIWLLATGRLRIPVFQRRWFFSADEDDEPSPYERLTAEAATLKMHLLNGDEKKFYDKLYLLVRSLISQKTGRSLDNATDSEIINMVKEMKEDDYFSRKVREMLEQCEKVRFGGYEPSSQESELALKELKDLLSYEERRYRKQLRHRG
ncbi:hypothetical protein J7M23_10535 [Candidatus Sumerlaeota bacterium]|nr:hypothetical protein [Candidatus Sumerlaeota bacterium]